MELHGTVVTFPSYTNSRRCRVELRTDCYGRLKTEKKKKTATKQTKYKNKSIQVGLQFCPNSMEGIDLFVMFVMFVVAVYDLEAGCFGKVL